MLSLTSLLVRLSKTGKFMKETKEGFKNIYSFLSNFHQLETPIKVPDLRGGYVEARTVEHAYVMLKSKDPEFRQLISERWSVGTVKKLGSLTKLRDDWDDIKLKVMEKLVSLKFSDANPSLRDALVETSGIKLVEYNWHQDSFYGFCNKTQKGENHLGKILMRRRQLLIDTIHKNDKSV